jgi:choline dehydrogenase
MWYRLPETSRQGPRRGARTSLMTSSSFDYIIVGAGTAGCLLANRLSADAQARAADRGRRARRLPLDPHPGGLPVLHRQPAHRLALPHRTRRRPERPQAALPARQGAGRLLQHQRHDLHARPGARLRPLGAADGRRQLALGRTACRTSSSHEDHWRGAGFDPTVSTAPAANGGWRSSACAGTSSTPLRRPRSRPAFPPPTTSTAATTKAWATSRSTSARAGAGTRPRPSCGPVHGRPNLQVWTGAQVAKLLLESADGALRATGVEVLCRQAVQCRHGHAQARGDPVRRAASARRRSCSCRASGPGRCCAQHGIAVVHDLPGVGANLQDHLQIRAVFKVQASRRSTPWPTRCGARPDRLEYAAARSGPDEHGAVAAGRVHPQRRRTSPGQHRIPRAAAEPGRLRRAAAPLSAFTASVCNLNPTSRGHGADPLAAAEDAPAIAPNYLSTAEDRKVAADSLR